MVLADSQPLALSIMGDIMRSQDAFDRRFTFYGGRLRNVASKGQWAPLLNGWKEISDSWVSILKGDDVRGPSLRSLYFDYIDNPSFNAVASELSGFDLVGVYSGSVINLNTMNSIFLSHPSVLPTVGDPSSEGKWFTDLSRCDWREPPEKFLRTVDWSKDVPEVFPIDRARRLFAIESAAFGLDFILAHEIGHILGGHIDYLRKNAGLSVYKELGMDCDVSATTRQAFELEADCWAARLVLTKSKGQAKKAKTIDPAGSRSLEEDLDRMLFALSMLFIAMDPWPSPVAQYKGRSHPHPCIRLINVVSCLQYDAMQKNRENEFNSITDVAKKVISHLAHICFAFESDSSVWYAMTPDQITDATETLLELHAHRARLGGSVVRRV